MLDGVVGQPPADDLLLDGSQFGWPTRHGPSCQAISTLSSEGGDPATDAAGIHVEEISDLLDGVTFLDSLDREPTAVLQNDR